MIALSSPFRLSDWLVTARTFSTSMRQLGKVRLPFKEEVSALLQPTPSERLNRACGVEKSSRSHRSRLEGV